MGLALWCSASFGQRIISSQIRSGTDDAEEYIFTPQNESFRTQGSMDLASSDIELGAENPLGVNPSIAGLRFTGLNLPQGAVVESAYIEFTVDANSKNEDPANYFIHLEDNVFPLSFKQDQFNISSRTWLNDSVAWNPEPGSWGVVGGKHLTSDISALIQQVINQNSQQEVNALAFFITGTGVREAESFEGSEPNAPRLILNIQESNEIFVPELLGKIPDQRLKQGWNFSLDIKPFFVDRDSELSFEVSGLAGNALPAGLEVANGVVSGSLDFPTTQAILVKASSQGASVSAIFNVVFEPNQTPKLTQLSTLQLGSFDEGAAEISAFDAGSQRLFVTNAELGAINILDFSNPSSPIILDTILLPAFAGGVNSVAVYEGKLAAAIENTPKQANGFVYVYDINGVELWNVEVGALPDMLTFNADGTKIIVANEGEPNDAYTLDPEGTVSIIDTASKLVTTVGFAAFNGQEAELFRKGIRIYGPNATVAQDLEPEYITIKGDTAYVSCQENNAIALIGISTGEVLDLVGLGFKDYSEVGNAIDLPDADGIFMANVDILGMYQPDAISSFQVAGKTYLITANEGDARDYDGYSEETSISKVTLEAASIDSADFIAQYAGKLKITTAHPDTTAAGEYKTLYSYGTRSFSIWDGETGAQVYDSGDELERITASILPAYFNASNTNFDFKNRSDDKGPEPEAVAVGRVDGVLYAFVGLERVGGIMVYDLTDPASPVFVEYVNNRDFGSGTPQADQVGDSGPEGIVFVPASQSPNNTALVIVSNEVSGTITTYSVGEAQPLFTLSIFHNNDGESDLLPEAITLNGVETTAGSISQFKYVLDSMRAQAVARDYASIMLSSGDNFLAGLEYNASQANGVYYDAIALDSLAYDAIDLGNHDFDFGTQVLSEFINAFQVNRAPFLSSNLGFENVPELQALKDQGRIASHVIIQKMGEEIGVIGLTTPLLPTISSPGKTIVSPAILDSVNAQIELLKAAGVNKIILISHLQNLDQEKMLASQLSDVDVIIAGGGDELLSNDPQKGAPYKLDPPVDSYPVVVANKDGQNTYLVTTPGNYRFLGNLLIDFDGQGNVTRVYESSDLILVTGPSNPDLKTQIEDPINEFIGDLATNVVAFFEDSVDFRRSSLRVKETNGGNLFADAMLWQAQQTFATFGVKEPQIALQNAGGLRIDQLIEPGGFTEDKTYATAAFTNILTVVEDIQAAHLLLLMEHGLSSIPRENGAFPQIAGFQVVFDPAREPNDRIRSITLDDGTKLVQNGEALQGAPAVSMATIDFTANGGDAYPFDTLTNTTLGATYQQAFLNYLVQGLDGLVTQQKYPLGMNERIIQEVSLSEALDSVVVDFSKTCPEIPQGWVEYHTQDDLMVCNGDRIQFNGFRVGVGASWLITPRVKHDRADYILNFTAENDFGRNAGPDAEVFYSTDYNGVGDPRGFTWVLLTEPTDFLNKDPKPTSLTNSGDLDLSIITQEAYLAFVYYSDATSGGGSSRLSLSDVAIRVPNKVNTAGFQTISEIQGNGEQSPFENSRVITSGIVTRVFDGAEAYTGAGYTTNMTGFFIQSNSTAPNETTSQGLFIASEQRVALGDSVILGGVVSESFGLTQLVALDSFFIASSGGTVPDPILITLPLAASETFEKYEGMRVEFVDELVVTENRNLENFGELRLAVNAILYQPTQLIDPNDDPALGNTSSGNSNALAVLARQALNDQSSILLSDARTGTNLMPLAFIDDADNSLRAGTKVTGVRGVLTYAFGAYQVIPSVKPVFDYAPADELPDLGEASLKVVSFNVLNYFNGDGQGAGFPTSRGAANPSAYGRQTQKIVQAMIQMDADIYALMEIENDEDNGLSAIHSLVDSLNTTIGSQAYTYIQTGVVKRSNGEFDEIKNGFIYKTASLNTRGDFALLNNAFDADYRDEQNRPSIAQTFEEKSTGETFTVVVCHLKSKGSDCNAIGDPDQNDGQGNCNVTRTKAAGALAAWLDTDPTGSNDQDFLILGDLNAYAQEDPIDTLKSQGFENLKSDETFTYVFDGQFGSLDHALANGSLSAQVTKADVWHINSIENDFKAYNGLASEFGVNPYWSSDHDPVMVGLRLTTVGTDPNTVASATQLYPNPTQGQLHFNLKASGSVINGLGVEVMSFDGAMSLDLFNQPKGLYIVRLINGDTFKVTLR